MATSWRQRFALSTYDNRWQEYFCASRCVEELKTYLAVRVCLFVSVLAVFVWSVAHVKRCYLIYLTNQMLIIEVVYLAFAAYTTVLRPADTQGRERRPQPPRVGHEHRAGEEEVVDQLRQPSRQPGVKGIDDREPELTLGGPSLGPSGSVFWKQS